MKSELHQRGFLSVRMLLVEFGYTDEDLVYDSFGKPHLKDGKYISITHSYTFSAVVISSKAVGVDIEKQREKIIKIAPKFAEKELEFFDPREQTGFLRTLMIRNTLGGEVMVLIQFFREDKNKRELLLNFIQKRFPQIVSLLYCINSKGNDSIYDQEIYCYSGQSFISEHIDDLQFKITAKSFYQTNPKQSKTLYNIAKSFAGLKPKDVVYDLYTGTGTIAQFIAKQATKVVGVEAVQVLGARIK